MVREFRPTSNGRRLAWSLAGALWIMAVAGGLAAMVWHESSAVAERVPADWPGDGPLKLGTRGTTLVLFAHPRCPCTRATLAELEKLVAHAGPDLSTWVVFFKLEGAEAGWAETESAAPGRRDSRRARAVR